MRTLAGAVHHAHQRGVVHRDLKPADILFTADGTPKVTDFGVARVASALPPGGVALTEVGTVVGTPQYMAPEQALGLPDGTAPAVDVYSLGAMLYDQLSGRAGRHPDGGGRGRAGRGRLAVAAGRGRP